MLLPDSKIMNKNYFYFIAGLSLIIIFSSILLALYTITDNYKSLSFLDKSYGVNGKIDRIYSILKDEENRQQGYLITHHPSFFVSNDIAEQNIDLEFAGIY